MPYVPRQRPTELMYTYTIQVNDREIRDLRVRVQDLENQVRILVDKMHEEMAAAIAAKVPEETHLFLRESAPAKASKPRKRRSPAGRSRKK